MTEYLPGRDERRQRWNKHATHARTQFALCHIGRPVDPEVVERELASMLRVVINARFNIFYAGMMVALERYEASVVALMVNL